VYDTIRDAILTGIVVVVVIVPFTLSSIFSNHCDNVHSLFINAFDFVMSSVKAGYLPQQQAQQPHLHIHHQQQQQQQLAAELASRRHLTNQQFIENELAKIQQEKLRIQRQQETLAQKVSLECLVCLSVELP